MTLDSIRIIFVVFEVISACISTVQCFYFSVLQESERVDECVHLRGELNHLQNLFDEKAQNLNRAEDVIEQLTHELNTTQDELNKAQDRVILCESAIEKYKEQTELLQQEVSGQRKGLCVLWH